jgi:transcriptional regulator with XRE-family HTH domain
LDVDALQAMVRQRRARDGISLRTAAEQSDVPFNTLARIERGHLPDLANFRRIVNWLGVPADRFFAPIRTRAESTPETIAHHLLQDPDLSPQAATQIAALVRDLYRNLVQPRSGRVHLRAAQTFVPQAATELASLLARMQHELEVGEPGSDSATRV